jgi:hypothetical protein
MVIAPVPLKSLNVKIEDIEICTDLWQSQKKSQREQVSMVKGQSFQCNCYNRRSLIV